MLTVSTGARTDVGRVRRLNEDSYVIGRRLWMVADGMGGHAAGDVASHLIAERFDRLRDAPTLRRGDIETALREANTAVVGYGISHPVAQGLGSTVTGLAGISTDAGERWLVFNVGDSRVYSWLGGELTRVTVDHSEVEELIAAGALTPDEGRVHPLRNVITRSLGSRLVPEPDYVERPQVPGERFVVCSDGLNSELTDVQIAAIMAQDADPQSTADALVAAALDAGGHDNVTVVVLQIGD